MDILIEIVLDIYLELMFLIVPEKNATKKHILIAKIIALLVLAGLFALVIFGLVLLLDHGNKLGIIPIVFAAVISIVQIAAGIVLYKKHH